MKFNPESLFGGVFARFMNGFAWVVTAAAAVLITLMIVAILAHLSGGH